MRISPPPASVEELPSLYTARRAKSIRCLPKSSRTSLELDTVILVLPDIRSFHFCRFLCCTSVMSLTVRTAKALRLSSSSYIPLRLAREPYTLHLGTCSLVQVLSCTIVHTISKNRTRNFFFEIRCFSCCSPLTYISVPQAGSI
jgi:hypothetical protein